MKERLDYLSSEIEALQREEESQILAELIKRVPSDSIPSSSSSESEEIEDSAPDRSRNRATRSSSTTAYEPVITSTVLARTLRAAVPTWSITTSNTREAYHNPSPTFAGVSDIDSIKDVQVGNTVYITNSITNPSDEDTKDRSATVTKVSLLSRHISLRTDSGAATYRIVRNMKFLREA